MNRIPRAVSARFALHRSHFVSQRLRFALHAFCSVQQQDQRRPGGRVAESAPGAEDSSSQPFGSWAGSPWVIKRVVVNGGYGAGDLTVALGGALPEITLTIGEGRRPTL